MARARLNTERFTWEADYRPPARVPSTGDLHLHTTCSDGLNTYEEMVQKALSLGLGFIAITDHRFDGQGSPCGAKAGTCDDTLCARVIEQCRNETRLPCIPGMEVTGRLHVLALGIQHGVDASLPLRAQVAEIHRQGGLAIAAHPWVDPWRYTEDEVLNSGLDASECIFSTGRIPCVYNSDAHSVSYMGKKTTCDAAIGNLEELKTALKQGKCRW